MGWVCAHPINTRKENMQRYMSHPKHGRMPVYSIQEMERNKANGWQEETEQEIKQETPQVKLKGKPGRKPKNPH